MPKISGILRLRKTQRELDFIDIDPNKDKQVFLNPFTLSTREDPFSINAYRTITSFFQQNLELIQNGDIQTARENFQHLNEPNETCLGLSKGKPRGRGMGDINTDQLFESILESEAVKSGLIEDLADTAIFIPKIGRDKVSDMSTNILRLNLIEYTQTQCKLLGVPLTPDVPSGFFWDIKHHRWSEIRTEMLIIKGRKILLVPKGTVSYVKEFTPGKYHNEYALTFLQEDHLLRNTKLVQKTYNKNGSIRRRFVTKKSLIEEVLPEDKLLLAEFTTRYPKIFKDFRQKTALKIEPLSNDEFENIDENQLIDHLIRTLESIPPGSAQAGRYHSLMIGILEFIFYPSLINPTKELEINEGRKRIDICFDNGASSRGFFYRVQHAFEIPCPYIFFECKNYSEDLDNPVLDQMVGRFSPNRGKFGIIICRNIDNESLFMKRCSDSYKDQHGLIIPLTDNDITLVLQKKKEGVTDFVEVILAEKARTIMNS